MALSGYLMVLLAYTLWAVSALFFKKAVSQHSPLLVTCFGALAGALVLLPFIALYREEAMSLPKLSWLWIVLAGILWISLGEVLYNYGLKQIPLSHLGLIGLSFPVVATALGVMFLDEQLTIRFLLGSAVMVSGFLIVVL